MKNASEKTIVGVKQGFIYRWAAFFRGQIKPEKSHLIFWNGLSNSKLNILPKTIEDLLNKLNLLYLVNARIYNQDFYRMKYWLKLSTANFSRPLLYIYIFTKQALRVKIMLQVHCRETCQTSPFWKIYRDLITPLCCYNTVML